MAQRKKTQATWRTENPEYAAELPSEDGIEVSHNSKGNSTTAGRESELPSASSCLADTGGLRWNLEGSVRLVGYTEVEQMRRPGQ